MAYPVSATPSKPPAHRRSFSGIKTSLGLSSSPSLPQLGVSKSSLTVDTPFARPSLSDDDRSYMPLANGPPTPVSNHRTNAIPAIRSFRSKFSFASPATPGHRSVSAGSAGVGAFMAKLPFGSSSPSPKFSKSKAIGHTAPSTPTSSQTTSKTEKDDESSVLRISPSPPSPQWSFSTDKELPAEPALSSRSSSPPLYPAVLGSGLPRSPRLPPSSGKPANGVNHTLVPESYMIPTVRDIFPEHSPPPSSISSQILRPSLVMLERRPSKLAAIDQSRISEHTEPDSSMDQTDSLIRSRHSQHSSSPLRAADTSSNSSDTSSEGQIRRDLLQFGESTESLTKLAIPAIPRSETLHDLPPLLKSPTSASESSWNEKSTEQHSTTSNSADEEFVSAQPSARSSVAHPAVDPDLAALLSPHRYESNSSGDGDVNVRVSFRATSSRANDALSISTSTPMKSDRARPRSNAHTVRPSEPFSVPFSPSSPGSPVYQDYITSKRSSSQPISANGNSSLSSPLAYAGLDPSPSPSPHTHRRRPSVTKIMTSTIRPHTVRSTSDKPPVAGTRRDYSTISRMRGETTDSAADRYATPEPRRPPVRLSPRSGAESPTTTRSYSSLGANTHQLARRAGVDEVFTDPGTHTSNSSGSIPENGETDPVVRPRRSHSVGLRRPSPQEDNVGSIREQESHRSAHPGDSVGVHDRGASVSSDWLGPRTLRAFQAAGLLESRSSGSGPYFTRGDPLQRPQTATPYSFRDRGSPSPVYGGGRRSSGEGRYYGNSLDNGSGVFSGPLRSSFETVRPESASGYTSSSHDPTGGLGRRGSASATHVAPISPVSSSRTLYSSSTNPPTAVRAMQERHELEKDAILTALSETKRLVHELHEENSHLRERNREMHTYAMDLERRIANLEQDALDRAQQLDNSTSRVIRRRAHLATSPQRGDLSAPMTTFEFLEPPVRRKTTSPVPAIHATPASPNLLSQPGVAVDISSPSSSMTIPAPTPARQSHRRADSDASSVLPPISSTMSMLMCEEDPGGSETGLFSSAEVDYPRDDVQNDDIRFKRIISSSSRNKNGRVAPVTHSPTESSFALTSAPGSPGSMMLRSEDEIHLNDLMSLRDDSDA